MLSVSQLRLVRRAVQSKQDYTAEEKKDSLGDTLNLVALPFLVEDPPLLIAWRALPTSSKVVIAGAVGLGVYGVVQAARCVMNTFSPVLDGVLPDDWDIPVIGPALKALGLKTSTEASLTQAYQPDTVAETKSTAPEVQPKATPEEPIAPLEKKSESAPIPAPSANAPSRSGNSVADVRSVVRPLVKGTNVKITGVGSTVMMSESGGDPGKVSSGKGDAGGVSYGLYQLATNRGGPQAYLAQSAYGAEFTGLKAGTKEFSDKWKEVAARDPKGFAADQQAYAEAVYYWPVVRAVKTATGYDISMAGAGVKEIAFSTSIQYGPVGTKKQPGSAIKFINALTRLGSAPTDIDVINAVQGEKAANVASNFRSSSVAVQQSVAQRIERERQIAVNNSPDSAKMASASPTVNTASIDRSNPSVPVKGASSKAAMSSNTQVAQANPVSNVPNGNVPVSGIAASPTMYQTDGGLLIAH